MGGRDLPRVQQAEKEAPFKREGEREMEERGSILLTEWEGGERDKSGPICDGATTKVARG